MEQSSSLEANTSSRKSSHFMEPGGSLRFSQTPAIYPYLDILSQINLVYASHSTYSMFTLWCRVLLEKLTGLQLVKKSPAFHRTRKFITALTSFRHLFLSWASPIQSIYPHPTSWRSILILSSLLCLDLQCVLFPPGFPTKNLYTPSPHPHAPHAQPISFFSIYHPHNIGWRVEIIKLLIM